MRIFNYINLKNIVYDNEVVNYLTFIHSSKVKQEMHLNQHAAKFDRLVEIAKIRSTEASNAIEGIRTTSTRLKQIATSKAEPKNRSEEEIAGYRDALNIINENYDNISITPNYILQLHKILFQYSPKTIGGKFKNTQNYINEELPDGSKRTIFVPLEPFITPDAIQNICDQYNRAISQGDVDPLILIPIFIHDFLCIHPFLDGNGRMSRLLTTLLLYKSGYWVGKYISLETKIAYTKNDYYSTLEQAQYGWYTSNENCTPFVKYMLGIIAAAYREFEDRATTSTVAIKSVKAVRDVIMHQTIGKFTKADILEKCPHLSSSSIESAIKLLVGADIIVKHGTGRATYYTLK